MIEAHKSSGCRGPEEGDLEGRGLAEEGAAEKASKQTQKQKEAEKEAADVGPFHHRMIFATRICGVYLRCWKK